MSGIDWQAMDDDSLRNALEDGRQELHRRAVLADAPQRAEDLAREVLTARDGIGGVGEGGAAPEWVQPSGAHDAYPAGWRVSHGGKVWVSLTPANVWEPGVSGWREVPTGGEEGGEENAAPEWVQPTGAHDAYQTGDRVTFNGAVWESTIDGNVWSPTDYPAGWKSVATPSPQARGRGS